MLIQEYIATRNAIRILRYSRPIRENRAFWTLINAHDYLYERRHYPNVNEPDLRDALRLLWNHALDLAKEIIS